MRGIILAGGKGTRLYPLTKVTNKHLLPIYNKPMIYYPLETLKNSGIDDIMIITGKENAGGFLNLLGSGSEFGVSLTYRLQEEADGIAGALKLCEDFSNGESVVVVLGDNIFENCFYDHFQEFKNNKYGACIFVKEVKDPRRFGVVEFDKNNKVISIEEKPENPKSNFAQTGLYIYDNNVFKYIEELKPSTRGELEITDINNIYLKNNRLITNIVDGEWIDAGTFESLHKSNVSVFDRIK